MELRKAIHELTEAGLGLVYPDVCQLCLEQRATVGEGYVCVECWGGLQFIRPPYCQRCGLPFEGDITTEFECSNCREVDLHFQSARAAVVFQGPVMEALHRYKYQRALWFEPFLADLLIREAGAVLREGRWDCIVPTPLHAAKEREREFNQAERLARRLGEAVGLPVRTDLVRRVVATRTQTRLDRAARAANVRDAFAVREGVQLNGERMVIIDDVLTTGATTSACAHALRRAGAGELCVWTVARGL